MASVSKFEAVSNFSWRYIGKLGSQIISFTVTVILARLIAPEAFGAVAIVTIFTSLLQVFVDSGLGSALIQKKNVDDVDFSSVFYFNIFICFVLYWVLYLCSPLIADFYNNQKLTELLRVTSLSLIIVGLRNTQETYVARNLLFKKHFVATTVSITISAIIGVIMAYSGFGAWAIVGLQLSNTGISTLLLWYIIPWRPNRSFSLERLKGLLTFGVKVLGANIADTLYSEMRSLLIGKVYSAKDLAYYDRGKQFPYLIVSGVNGALNSIMLPVLSREQDDVCKIKYIVRRIIRITLFFISSILAFLICSAESIIATLMTEKWLPCVLYLQILCFDTLLWPIIAAHYNSYQAVGKSDVYMKIVLITKALGIILLVLVIKWSVIYVAISSVLAMVFQLFIVAFISKKCNKYGYSEQVSDIVSGVMPGFMITICIWWVNYLNIDYCWKFTAQVLITIITFIGYSKLSKAEGYELLEELIKAKIKSKHE